MKEQGAHVLRSPFHFEERVVSPEADLQRGRLLVAAASVALFVALGLTRYLQHANLSPFGAYFYEFFYGYVHPAGYPRLPEAWPLDCSTRSVTFLGWVAAVQYELIAIVLGPSQWSHLAVGVAMNALTFAGGPLLYEIGVRTGLPARRALLPALSYVACYSLVERAGWDFVLPTATAWFAAVFAVQQGRRVLLGVALFTILGSYLVAYPSLVAFIWLVRRFQPRDRPEVLPRWFAIGLTALTVATFVAFVLMFTGVLRTTWTLEALRSSSFLRVAAAQNVEHVATVLVFNLAGIAVLFASFGFLSLTRSVFLLLALPDVGYYLLGRLELGRSPVDHGQIPVTAALLALASIDGLRRLPTLPPRRQRLLLVLGVVGPLLPWVVGGLAPWSRIGALLPSVAATPAIEAVHEAVARIPEGARCETHTSFALLAETRCLTTTFFQRYSGALAKTGSHPELPAWLLVDLARLAGRRDREGFTGTLVETDGGCAIARGLLADLRQRRCAVALERGEIVLLGCTDRAGGASDATLVRRVEAAAAECVPERRDLHLEEALGRRGWGSFRRDGFERGATPASGPSRPSW